MKPYKLVLIAAFVVAAGLVAGGDRPVSTRHRVVAAHRPAVIRLDGMGSIEFGDTEQELIARGLLDPGSMACAPGLAGMPTTSPVFVDERLVLLWVGPSTVTPEGVTTGTPVSQVRVSYPRVTRLRAPAGSYRFDGLLARHGDRAYLFLHDGRTVRKTIAGYTRYAQKFFAEGIDLC